MRYCVLFQKCMYVWEIDAAKARAPDNVVPKFLLPSLIVDVTNVDQEELMPAFLPAMLSLCGAMATLRDTLF